jgi:hypothetical protein
VRLQTFVFASPARLLLVALDAPLQPCCCGCACCQATRPLLDWPLLLLLLGLEAELQNRRHLPLQQLLLWLLLVLVQTHLPHQHQHYGQKQQQQQPGDPLECLRATQEVTVYLTLTVR